MTAARVRIRPAAAPPGPGRSRLSAPSSPDVRDLRPRGPRKRSASPAREACTDDRAAAPGNRRDRRCCRERDDPCRPGPARDGRVSRVLVAPPLSLPAEPGAPPGVVDPRGKGQSPGPGPDRPRPAAPGGGRSRTAGRPAGPRGPGSARFAGGGPTGRPVAAGRATTHLCGRGGAVRRGLPAGHSPLPLELPGRRGPPQGAPCVGRGDPVCRAPPVGLHLPGGPERGIPPGDPLPQRAAPGGPGPPDRPWTATSRCA